MSKFKIGDKVKYVGNSEKVRDEEYTDTFLTRGEVYTITSVWTISIGDMLCLKGFEEEWFSGYLFEKYTKEEKEYNQCKVAEPFLCTIEDMFGNSFTISLGRGRKFEYKFKGDKLILLAKGMKLVIPKSEFKNFAEID